ncbi:hypothetical protein ILYODFUR_026864 [Ilyodon furcidens]|uniref:Uncharacterized protein n=1 Tax=Ilyodon furcidens TaxID=33524 RepID=A0ABV0TZ58_9TELE
MGPRCLAVLPDAKGTSAADPLRRGRSLSRRQRILLDKDRPVSRLLRRGQPGQTHRSGQNAAVGAGMIRKHLPEMVNTKAGRAHVMTVLRLQRSRTGRTTKIVHDLGTDGVERAEKNAVKTL